MRHTIIRADNIEMTKISIVDSQSGVADDSVQFGSLKAVREKLENPKNGYHADL